MTSSDRLKLAFGAVFTRSWPKLIKDLLSLASGRVVSMLIGFAAFAYLARVLGPKAYGVVEFAIAITAFAAIIIECGVGPICVRELIKHPGRGRELAAQSTLARLLLALLIVPLIGVAATMANLTPTAVTLVWLYAFSLLAVPLNQEWVLQGYGKMTPAAIALPIRAATLAGGIFLLIRGAADLVVVGLIEICAVAAVTAYYVAAQYAWTVPFRFHWSPRETLYLLKEGSLVGLSNGLWAFMIYAPMILLTNLVGSTETGFLGAAQRIAIAMVPLSIVYYFNLYPVMAKTVKTDVKAFQLDFKGLDCGMALKAIQLLQIGVNNSIAGTV